MKKNKYIMISLSVILAVVILLIPNNEIKALEFTYDNVTFDTDEIVKKIDNYFYPSVYQNVSNYRKYQIAFVNDNKLYFLIFRTDSSSSTTYLDDLNKSFNISGVGAGGYVVSLQSGMSYIYNFSTSSESYSSYSSTNNFYWSATTDFTDDMTEEEFINSKVLYSNINLKFGDYVRPYGLISPIFNKTYSSSEYSKIEVDFEIPSVVDSLGVDFELNLSVNSLVEENQSGFPFSSPYLEFTYNLVSVDDTGAITTSVKRYTDIVYISDVTDYKYYLALIKNVVPGELKDGDKYHTSVKLVIPFDSAFTSDINVNFESNFDYEVTEYSNDEYSYELISLDLTNKKGAILVTKDIENTFSANFKVNGYFYLEFRDSISDTDYNVEKTYTYGFCDLLLEDKENYMCSTSDKFSYYFGADNPYRVLHFRNLHSDESTTSTIYYDSTKFDVYIIENDTEFVVITDPVTGNETIFDVSIFENNSQSEVTVEYLVSLIEDFLKNNDNAWDLVREVLELFFDYMPAEIYQALVTVLFVIFLCVVVMIVGWK